MATGFDVLLRVVPCAASICHVDRNRESAHENASKHCAECVDRDESSNEWNDDCKCARNEHLAERCFSRNRNTARRVRNDSFFAFPETRDLAELSAYFFNHLVCCTANGIDGKCCKEE